MRRKVLQIGAALLGLMAIGELAARVLFGLGNPVLYVADPRMEYMMKPSQDVMRFGRHIVVNEYGMRSEAIAKNKASARELRVLVVGDSVVNGGNRIDQAQLATTRLQRMLATATGRPVVVGNVSAGSWGPQNMLAWLQRFGLLHADVLVLVLSSHDASDVPTFAPLDPATHPTVRPKTALGEGLAAVFRRYGSGALARKSVVAEVASERRPPDDAAIEALRELLRYAGEAGTCVTVVQHFTRSELSEGPGPGHEAIQLAAGESGATVLDDEPALSAELRLGHVPYQDNIHLSEPGQGVLAGVLMEAVQRCQRPEAGRNVTGS